jgi:hypothetical protein
MPNLDICACELCVCALYVPHVSLRNVGGVGDCGCGRERWTNPRPRSRESSRRTTRTWMQRRWVMVHCSYCVAMPHYVGVYVSCMLYGCTVCAVGEFVCLFVF